MLGEPTSKRYRRSGPTIRNTVHAPRGFSADSPHLEDLKRKDFIGVVNFAAKDTESRDFVKQVASTFRKANPFMMFLCAAVGVEF